MAAIPLAELVLLLAVDNGHPGRSPFSLEPAPECGTSATEPACTPTRYCDDPAPSCRAPRYSAPRHAWVRMETRRTAERRFAQISKSLASTAMRLASCQSASGEALAGCQPLDWPSSERSLALAALTVALHESGLREDVQFGYPPLGRGPRGEACLMQVAPDQALAHAVWLAAGERERISTSAREREQFLGSLLGDSPAALERCFELGMRMLVRARKGCGRAGVAWDFGMFSLYGGGKSCNVVGIGTTRAKTFRALAAARPEPSPELSELLR